MKLLLSKVMALFAYLLHPTASYSNIAAVFCATSKAEPEIQLNVRQRASFSLVSVFCPQIFCILPITCISVACAVFRIHAHTQHQGLLPNLRKDIPTIDSLLIIGSAL